MDSLAQYLFSLYYSRCHQQNFYDDNKYCLVQAQGKCNKTDTSAVEEYVNQVLQNWR